MAAVAGGRRRLLRHWLKGGTDGAWRGAEAAAAAAAAPSRALHLELQERGAPLPLRS